MSVADIIDELASDNSRLFKESVLRREIDNGELKEVIRLALDPLTQFYIRKIPAYEPNQTGHAASLQSMLPSLDSFTQREVTGNAAIDRLQAILSAVNARGATVIEKIIQKDLRCGVSEATANKIWPGLVPAYPCMLASAYDEKLIAKVKYPAYVQLKLDGMRFNAIVKNGDVEFRSRNGKDIQIADVEFYKQFLIIANGQDVVFDGELLVKENGVILDRKTGNGILNKAVKGTQSKEEGSKVHATIWDVIPFEAFEKGKHSVPYSERFSNINTRLTSIEGIDRICAVETSTVNSLEQAQELFETYLANGQEGIILKTQDMIWEDKRSKHQIKFKGELECDLLCIGWEEGTGKNIGRLGALVLQSSDGKVKTNVGTGFTDAMRDSITPDVVGKVIAIKYNARVTDKRSDVDSLFLPVFIEVREDKSVPDHSEIIK